MLGLDMREEVSRSPYATKGTNFVVQSVEAGRSSCEEQPGDGFEAFQSVSRMCFSISAFSGWAASVAAVFVKCRWDLLILGFLTPVLLSDMPWNCRNT